jgi:glycosyltransferase involved in cell wall biosynthesis
MASPPPDANGPLRVLVVTNLWPEDGGFRGIFVKEQVDAVRALGHHVDVEVVAQARGRADYLLAAPRVRRRARDYDVVHVHYGLAALAARFAGDVPRVLTLHGSDVNVPWQAFATRLGSGALARRVYVSDRLAAAAGDRTGVVIPGGVDFTRFTPIDRAEARARLGLDPAVPVALFGARRRQARKRYDVFRAVVDALRERGLPVQELVLAEPRPQRGDVPLRFAASDVLLFTSEHGHEGSPTVVKEAAVMGLPVVTTDVGDVSRVLDGVVPSAVVAFPPGWPGDGARRELVAALTHHAAAVLAAPTRSNGRERAAWLDSTLVAQRVVAVYREATGVRGGASEG